MSHETLKKQVADAILTIQKEAQQSPIVLVFGLGSYGDVIQITPLLRALKRKFPEARIILVHPDLLGSTLLESATYLDRYIRIPSGYHYLLRSKLKNGEYDLIVECRYVVKYTLAPNPRLNEKHIAFIRAAQDAQKPWLGLVQNFPFDNDRIWRQAKSKGWSMYDLMAHTSGFPGEDFETLHLDPPRNKPSTAKFSFPASYIVVSNSAEWLPLQSHLWTKSLPHTKMREVLRELKTKGVPTVLLGTSNDPGDYPVDYDLRGKTNLMEAAEIITNARLVLGPEGGLVNMAKAVGTPSVVFFGSTPVEFFGFKTNINIVPSYCGGCWWSTESYLRQCPLLHDIPPCTDSLDTKKIIGAVQQLFKNQP